MAAMAKAMENTSTMLSAAGPDGTKVGTDLSITVAIVANQQTGVVGICPPEAQRGSRHPP